MGKRKIVEFKQNIVLLNFTIVFRTTPVFVYPISGTLKENFKLQYNSCYCLSEVLYPSGHTDKLFQYNSCYCLSKYPYQRGDIATQFQYNSCYCLSQLIKRVS